MSYFTCLIFDLVLLLNENIMHETVVRMEIMLLTDRFIEYKAPRNIDWYRSLHELQKCNKMQRGKH
jgi:hypothetical protein